MYKSCSNYTYMKKARFPLRKAGLAEMPMNGFYFSIRTRSVRIFDPTLALSR